MKKLLLALVLLPSLALAQRGGAIRPIQNLATLCTNVAEGYSCTGYERQWCVDYANEKGYACSPTSHVWVKFGEQDTANVPTNVATADALSANGANCAAGTAPLGVSAAGAVEGCFSVQTLDADLTDLAALNFCSAGQIPKSTGGTTWACSADSTGGSPTFDTVGTGSNTTATMTCGTGCAITTSGSGTNTANALACTTCVDMATEVGAFASADLAGRLSDETGTGVVVLATSPTFVTNPLGPTASADDNDTSLATTAYVQTELTAYASDNVTFTTKTLDAESSGNSLVVPTKAWLPAAGCQATTASSFWDNLTANPAVAACVTGSNTQKGVLDFDADTDEFAQQTIMLPSDWSGTVDAKFVWLAAATSGNVVWSIQTICVADTVLGETDDPSFNTASTSTDAAKGTTLQINTATITGVTSIGCAAGELMHINISRDANNASDTMTGDARLIGVEITMRRSM